jgi:CheY-like chemotaxis protein
VLLTGFEHFSGGAPSKLFGSLIRLSRPTSRKNLLWCLYELLHGTDPAKARDPAARPQEPVELKSKLGTRRVLIAEDNVVNQKIATRFLDKLGLEWELTGNGEEAVEAFQRSEFDLVLLDLQMPVMDGLEAARRICELAPDKGLRPPLIALTASVLEEHREKSKAAGFDDYLTKPIKLETLRECLLHWISEPRAPIGSPAEHRSPELRRLLAGESAESKPLRLRDWR